MLVFLDWFFVIFHGAFTLFNVLGWVCRKTRFIHLITMGGTWLSWIILGFFYGFGYCPLTDWHWQVKRELGQTGLPASYVKYYLDKLTGMDWQPATVDIMVVGLAAGALVLSIVFNVRDYRKAKSA